MTEPRPCSAVEAVRRARDLLASPSNKATGYYLGTGNYHPQMVATRLIDVPWTQVNDKANVVHIGCDCAGVICWAYKTARHRPGYNRGGRFDVEDDINTSSMLGDAFGARDLYELATGMPQPGDVIAYPTFRIHHEHGELLTFIGHTALVVGVSRVTAWDQARPQFHLLDVIQVKGPNGRMPAAIATDGALFDHHNEVWPKEQHRAWLLRAVP